MAKKRDISGLPHAEPWKKPKGGYPKGRPRSADHPWKANPSCTLSAVKGGGGLEATYSPREDPPGLKDPLVPDLTDPVIEDVKEVKVEADAIVERVWGEAGTGVLTKADEKFVELNRMYIVLAAQNRGIDLTGRFLDCVEKSYEVGMGRDFKGNAILVTGAVSLGSRKHVTDTVGDLAGLKQKESDGDGPREIKVYFDSSFSEDGKSECTVGVSIRTSPETT